MPFLAPISENGRPISSICSFCGRSKEGIRSLDCGYHFICDDCSRQRYIYFECPLCASRDRHSVEASCLRRNNSFGVNNCLHRDDSFSSASSPAPSIFPSVPSVSSLSSLPVQPDFGVPSLPPQGLPVYQPQIQSNSYELPKVSTSEIPFNTKGDSYGSIYDSNDYPVPLSIQQEINNSFKSLQGEAIADCETSDLRHQRHHQDAVPAIPINYQKRSLPSRYPSPPSICKPQYTAMAAPQPTSSYTSYAPSQSMYTSYNTGEEWSQPAYPITSIPSSSNVARPVSKAFMALNASRSGQIGSGPQPLRSSRENLVLTRQKDTHLDENAIRSFWNQNNGL